MRPQREASEREIAELQRQHPGRDEEYRRKMAEIDQRGARKLTKTAERRQQYVRTVETAREGSKTITPLAWTHDLPDDTEVPDFPSLQRMARVSAAPGTPVVSEVLSIARTLRWLVSVWAETEQVKNRRHYVRAEHGDPEPLPPHWLAAVRSASTNRLPL